MLPQPLIASGNKPAVQPSPARLALWTLFAAITSWAALYVFSIHARHFFVLGELYFTGLLCAGGALLFLPLAPVCRRVLSSSIFWAAVVCLLAAADLARYHVHDHGPRAGTAGPALTLPARELLRGGDPYQVRLSDGAPISPGPGWILLLAPLTAAGGVSLVTPMFLFACAALIGRTNPCGAGVFLCLVMAQPAFVAASFGATDLFAIPVFYAVLCLLAERYAAKDSSMALLAVPAAAFATSRIPMVGLVLILGVGLYRRRPRAGIVFTATALLLTGFCHALFYLWARHDGIIYQPMHLFDRAAHAGHGAASAGAVAALAVGVGSSLRMRGRARDWILTGGLLLTAAFVPVGTAELATSGDWTRWEGSSYVSFGASLLLAALVLSGPTASTEAESPRS